MCYDSVVALHCTILRGGVNMKKFTMKYGDVLSAFALVVTTVSSNRVCNYIFPDPKLPESAKHLRKF